MPVLKNLDKCATQLDVLVCSITKAWPKNRLPSRSGFAKGNSIHPWIGPYQDSMSQSRLHTQIWLIGTQPWRGLASYTTIRM